MSDANPQAKSAIPPPTRTRTSTVPPNAPRTPPTPPAQKERPSLAERVKKALTPRARVVRELLQIPMIPLAGLATYQHARNPGQLSPYALDIRTIELHGDEFSQAVADVADGYPVLAAVLDRIGTVTPFMGLLSAGLAMGAQFAENHGRLPEHLRGLSPATIPKQEFAEMMVREAAEAQLQANGDSGN